MKTLFFIVAMNFVSAMAVSAAETPLDTVKTTFEDGSPSRVYTVLKGTDLKEGVSLTYHPNGKLAVEAPYKAGKLHGQFRSYYESGKLWLAIDYTNGVENGGSVDFYENGIKRKKETYKHGVLEGVVEEWTEKGTLKQKLPYVHGRIHGVAKVFDDLGGLKEEMTFEEGIRNGVYRRYQRGLMILEAQFKDNRCVKNCDF
ncbi:MAG: toxin-antitoxin system YwqK family antitoxin [Fibrobacteraceae bacterium]|nr:toxin-antitoxin system YwqK family antitoxin [Fibrobacteraceae bacterium]